MMTPAEAVDHFEQAALAWDECEYLDQPGDAEHILRLLKILPGETGLDLACGCGQLTVRLGEGNCRILAADLCDRMLKLTARRVVEARLNNIVITVQDAHRLEFADGLFHWAVCRFGFRYFNEPGLVLDELSRVIKPGGRLYVSDWSSPAEPLNELLKSLDGAHCGIYDEAWWEGELADRCFEIRQARMRADRLDSVVWGGLAGLTPGAAGRWS